MSSKTNTTATRDEATPALVPKLRFPEFRGSDMWERLTLKQVTTALLDGDWIESKDQSDSGYRLIQTGNVGVGEFIAKSGKARYVSEDTFARLRCTEIFPGDCLVSRLPDPAGRSCFIPDIGEKMITAVDCTIVRFDQTKIVPYLFIAHSQTDGYFREVAALSSGSTRQRISRENLSGLLLPLSPTPAEQQKIAECLSSVDELMAAQARKVDALKTHKKGLMQQLFPREGEAAPRLRFPEFRDAGEWGDQTVGDFGKVITGSTPSTAKPAFYGGGIPFVSPADISDLRFVDQTKTTLTPEGFAETRPVRSGSVLFVCIGSTIGKVAQSVRDCATNQQINAVVPSSKHSDGFVYFALSLAAERIALLAGRQAVPIINKSLFSSVRMLSPKLPEQQRIAACLSSLDALIAAETRKLEALKTHKKGLMQQLFPSLDAWSRYS